MQRLEQSGHVGLQFRALLCEVLDRVLTEGSKDGRRRIEEYVDVEKGFAIQRFTILGEEGTTQGVGNHYHEGEFEEEFTVMLGGGRFASAAVDEGGTPGEVLWGELKPGQTVVIEPYVAHYFELEVGTVMVCMVSGVDADHMPGQAVSCRISDK